MVTDELKLKLVDMFAWFHNFCMEHHLRYYALGGTMLGAARHEGFIPWDDDIDVGMPRADYDKLHALLAKQEKARYVLETPTHSGNDYYYPFSKLYDTETTLIENTKYQIKRGIYLDIFPLDGIGGSREEALENFKPVSKLYSLLLTRVTGIRQGRAFYKNAAVFLMQLIPGFIINNKKLLLKLVKKCASLPFDECAWVGNLVGAWRTRELMPREVLGEPRLYKFESIEVYGAADADAYLTYLYGNWRQLPPEDKRVSHHDFVLLDLHKSYLNDSTT